MAQDKLNRWQIRLFNPDADFAQLLALRRQLEALEPTGNDTSEEGLHAMLKIRGHDPAQDRWVVTTRAEPEKLLAHAWLFAQSQARIVTSIHVHPAWHRQGIGSALLATMLAHARHAGATQVTGGRWEPAMPAHHFLTHHGFEPVGHDRFFDAPADMPLPAPIWPDGYTAHTFAELQDLSLLAAVCNRCYHDSMAMKTMTRPPVAPSKWSIRPVSCRRIATWGCSGH